MWVFRSSLDNLLDCSTGYYPCSESSKKCKEYTYTQGVTTGHYRTLTRYIINGVLNDSVVWLWVKDSMLI